VDLPLKAKQVVVCLIAACAVHACASDDNDGCRGGSLEDYCSGSCRNYEEALAVANALEDPEDCNDDGTLNRQFSGAGTCGEFRWVMTRPFVDEFAEFFDGSGAMVGAIQGTDCNCFCGGSSFTIEYGFVPDCVLEPVNTPCAAAVREARNP
jgi:hypothetical protein